MSRGLVVLLSGLPGSGKATLAQRLLHQYAMARAGRLPIFAGVSDPYEEPVDAEVSIDTTVLDVAGAAERLFRLLWPLIAKR